MPCDRNAPCVVRAAFESLEEIGAIRDDARLIVSELVTNAVLHSGCSGDHLIDVRARLRGDRVVISVHDPGIGGESARVRAPDVSSRGGFGLRVVQQLARRWGAERPDGQRVWAELALPT